MLLSELAIWNEELGFATAIDVIGRDRVDGRVMIFEIKTGYNGYFKQSNQCMKTPLTPFADAPLNQAQVQLLLTRMTLASSYGYYVPYDCAYVIHVHDGGVNPYPLDLLLMSYVPKIARVITLRTRQQTMIAAKKRTSGKRKRPPRSKGTTNTRVRKAPLKKRTRPPRGSGAGCRKKK